MNDDTAARPARISDQVHFVTNDAGFVWETDVVSRYDQMGQEERDPAPVLRFLLRRPTLVPPEGTAEVYLFDHARDFTRSRVDGPAGLRIVLGLLAAAVLVHDGEVVAYQEQVALWTSDRAAYDTWRRIRWLADAARALFPAPDDLARFLAEHTDPSGPAPATQPAAAGRPYP